MAQIIEIVCEKLIDSFATKQLSLTSLFLTGLYCVKINLSQINCRVTACVIIVPSFLDFNQPKPPPPKNSK